MIHICVDCNYKTSDSSNWKRHCRAKKHLKIIEKKSEKNEKYNCKLCSFSCFHKNDFRKHKCNSIPLSDFIVDLVKQEKELLNRQEDIYDEIETIEKVKENKKLMKWCVKTKSFIYTYIHPKVVKLEREEDEVQDTLIKIQTKLEKYRNKLDNVLQPLLWKLITNKLKNTKEENKIKISGVDNLSNNQIELDFDEDDWDTY